MDWDSRMVALELVRGVDKVGLDSQVVLVRLVGVSGEEHKASDSRAVVLEVV
jgi:hypothetical protein